MRTAVTGPEYQGYGSVGEGLATGLDECEERNGRGQPDVELLDVVREVLGDSQVVLWVTNKQARGRVLAGKALRGPIQSKLPISVGLEVALLHGVIPDNLDGEVRSGLAVGGMDNASQLPRRRELDLDAVG